MGSTTIASWPSPTTASRRSASLSKSTTALNDQSLDRTSGAARDTLRSSPDGYAKADARSWKKQTTNRQAIIDQMEKESAQQEAANACRAIEAAESYAARLASVEPIILTSKETVTRYAETPACRTACLARDPVR